MNGVKFAFGGADAAADAFVRVHHRSAAAQAASGFRAHLLFGKGASQIPEIIVPIRAFSAGHLPFCVVKGFRIQLQIIFIQFTELS